jgi:hypothetical protein
LNSLSSMVSPKWLATSRSITALMTIATFTLLWILLCMHNANLRLIVRIPVYLELFDAIHVEQPTFLHYCHHFTDRWVIDR